MQTSTFRSDSRVLIIDTETSSLDPKTGHLLEVAVAQYSLAHGLVRAHSWVIKAPSNEAFVVNGIPVELVRDDYAVDPRSLDKVLHSLVEFSDAIVAHNAAFDSQWLPDLGKPWVCTCDDIEFPKPSMSKSLTSIALAHGVGVVHAHRALSDVMTLVALFDRVRENHDLASILSRGLRPKKLVAAVLPYDRKDEAKALGFRWQAETKQWTKRVAVEDIPSLGFDVKEVT